LERSERFGDKRMNAQGDGSQPGATAAGFEDSMADCLHQIQDGVQIPVRLRGQSDHEVEFEMRYTTLYQFLDGVMDLLA